MELDKRFLVLLLNALLSYYVHSREVNIVTGAVHAETNEKFVNVAIDSGVIKGNWETFRPNSTKVQTLASALAPNYIRVGGTDADFLIFYNDKASAGHVSNILQQHNRLNLPSVATQQSKGNARRIRDVGYSRDVYKVHTNFTMTASFYDQIHQFVSKVGWDLIFDLNSLLRQPNGAWEPTNAIELINYTAEAGYKMGGWELGNEPDEYPDKVPPEQLARDFTQLKAIVRRYTVYRDCEILGPSIASMTDYRRKGYFYSFLSSGGGDVVTAATFHQYYEDGAVAVFNDFINPDILNILYEEIQTGVNLTRASGSRARVWLGETSSAWRGGALGLSDRYVAGFMWLDKLGVSARDGINAVIRQTFYGGHYALLDRDTLDPNPDYWLTLLYKLLVGNRVLKVTSPDSRGKLRVYAHCTQTVKSGYPSGSVTVYALNLDQSAVDVTFPDFPASMQLHVYNMLPTNNDLKAQSVNLNGVPLQMINDEKLPNLLRPLKTTSTVYVSGLSYTFIVIPDANVAVCK